jgi:sugar lactone lactonase YvrE
MRSWLGNAKPSALIAALLCIWHIEPLPAQTPTPTPSTTIYVSDTTFDSILKFDPAGQMTIFASGITDPTGLALDGGGSLYVASATLQAIQKYNPAGDMSIFASAGLLIQPKGLAFDSNGFLYVADSNSVVRLDSTGQQTVFLGPSAFPTGCSPFDLAFDRDGDLYVTDPNNNAVWKFNPSGHNIGNLQGVIYGGPSALAFDGSGNLFVANIGHQIVKVDPAGQERLFAVTHDSIYGIAFDTDAEYLYVTQIHNHLIEKFDSVGQGSTFAAGLGSPHFIAVQPPSANITGLVTYCSNPVGEPAKNVTFTVTGGATARTPSNGLGNYIFALAIGGSYDVTPSKSPRIPGSAGINTVDVVAVQRHFLNIALIPPGCQRMAADVNDDTVINTSDIIAIQRFALGRSTGTANVGWHKFTPGVRSYVNLATNQINQDYEALVFGDVVSSFAE